MISDLNLRDDEERALAILAAHAASAINTGSEYSIAEIRKMVEEDLPEKLYWKLLKKEAPVAVRVLNEMLKSSR